MKALALDEKSIRLKVRNILEECGELYRHETFARIELEPFLTKMTELVVLEKSKATIERGMQSFSELRLESFRK